MPIKQGNFLSATFQTVVTVSRAQKVYSEELLHAVTIVLLFILKNFGNKIFIWKKNWRKALCLWNTFLY
jgi:hypothetical protein